MGPRAAEARCAPAGVPTRRSRPCRARPIPSRSSNWRARSGNDEGSGDFVTDLVGKIFGKDVLADPEPFGLKRMTREEWPDQWPANTTDFDVEPLETDDTVELREVVRPVLKQTQMEFLELGLAYDANVHGWSASSFHTQMDGQGAGLLVGVTDSGQTFGGYNPRGWLGYGEWRDAISAFLFVYQGKGNPLKSAKVGGSGMAIIDESGQGPQWGPDGLKISLSSRQAKSRLGTYYDRTTLGRSLFGGDPSTPVGLQELRVYVAMEETELARNYKPNAFQWQEGELEEIRKNDDGDGDSLLDKIFKNFNQ
ncbi:TLDc domain-containing protein [Chloropicon roscoffensis]|uniref:TLDc domain-containing protein n=1 Tax=Chloropicon roscoffensis TaxID=1461544 RepID=A0AAX4P2U1_9CHLO